MPTYLSCVSGLVATDYVTIAAAVVALLGGASVFAVVLFKGIWAKFIQPLIVEEVTKWYDHRDQRKAREDEVAQVIYKPAISENLDNKTVKVIENQIKRTDGLIAHEIKQKVDQVNDNLVKKLDEVNSFLRDDSEFKQLLLQRLSKLEGAVLMVVPFARMSEKDRE